MTDDMIAFYRARLADEERVATVAAAGWRSMPFGRSAESGVNAEALLHAALHGPVRVLADIEAKQRIVDAYLPPGGDPHPGLPCTDDVEGDPDGEIYAEMVFPDACVRHLKASKRLLYHDYVIRLLVEPYSDHPDYKDAWRP